MINDENAGEYVDPDPIVIVSTLISTTALILQFVQVRHELRKKPPLQSNPDIDEQQLDSLENAVDEIRNRLKALERTVERSSADIDSEFYDASFRVSSSELRIEFAQHASFNNSLSYLMNNVSQLSQWVNTIIRSNTRLAVRIGDKLSGPLSETAKNINAAIARGEPNRIIISEAKQAIEALASVIHDELTRKGN